MRDLNNKEVIVFLCIILLIGTLVIFLPNTRCGPCMRGLITSDSSRFAIATRFILKNEKIEYNPIQGVRADYFQDSGYPPGYMVLNTVLKSVSSLELMPVIMFFQFVLLMLYILATYVLSKYITKRRILSIIIVFFVVTFRNDVSIARLAPIILMRGSSVVIAIIPLIIYCLLRGMKAKRGLLVVFALLLASTVVTHSRTSLMTLASILLSIFLVTIIYRKKILIQISLVLLFVLFSILISYVLWLHKISLVSLFTSLVGKLSLVNVVGWRVFFLLIIIGIFLLFLTLFTKKKDILGSYFKKIKPIIYITAILFLIVYSVFLFVHFSNFEIVSNAYNYLYSGKRVNNVFEFSAGFYVLLNMGITLIGFLPLGLVHLFYSKEIDNLDKLVLISWFFLLFTNSVGIIKIYHYPHRLVPLLALPSAIIAAIGLDSLIKGIKRRFILYVIFFLVLIIPLYHSLDLSSKISFHDVYEPMVAANWGRENIATSNRLLADVVSSRAFKMFTNNDVITGIENVKGKYITFELINCFTIINPDCVIDLMLREEANYLILNKEDMRYNIKAINWIFRTGYEYSHLWNNMILPTVFSRLFQEYKEELGGITGEYRILMVKRIIMDKLLERKHLPYDLSENLDKVYSVGVTSLYHLNRKIEGNNAYSRIIEGIFGINNSPIFVLDYYPEYRDKNGYSHKIFIENSGNHTENISLKLIMTSNIDNTTLIKYNKTTLKAKEAKMIKFIVPLERHRTSKFQVEINSTYGLFSVYLYERI